MGLTYANDATKLQDSVNTLQRFIDKAPETNPNVATAKTIIAELIKGNNLQPPKPEPARGSRGPAKKKP
jgi:hypothetical protein